MGQLIVSVYPIDRGQQAQLCDADEPPPGIHDRQVTANNGRLFHSGEALFGFPLQNVLCLSDRSFRIRVTKLRLRQTGASMGTPQGERHDPEQAEKEWTVGDGTPPRIACVASDTDITIAVKAKGPIDPKVLDRLVVQQVAHRLDSPVAKVDADRPGHCFQFSQEVIVVLAHYYGISGSVIVQLRRPNNYLNPAATEPHHFVLLKDDRVVDPTADQFWSKGIGEFPKSGENDTLPRVYFRPWKEVIQGYHKIGFALEDVLSEEEFLAAEFRGSYNPGEKARENGACPALPAPPAGAYGSRKKEDLDYPTTVTKLATPPSDEAERIGELGPAPKEVSLKMTIEGNGEVSEIEITSPAPKPVSAPSDKIEAYIKGIQKELRASLYSPATINDRGVRSVISRTFKGSTQNPRHK